MPSWEWWPNIRRNFGFTAVLISHEIPDVYFISNRILALYDRKIVFQGTPEEFEHLDHPFREELISSIESLQHELTGLYSKRHFKVRYQTDLSRRDKDTPILRGGVYAGGYGRHCGKAGA